MPSCIILQSIDMISWNYFQDDHRVAALRHAASPSKDQEDAPKPPVSPYPRR